jgi:hypothetical protein
MKETKNKIFTNKQGSTFIVLNYTNSRDVRVKFLDASGYEKSVRWDHVMKGAIKNPYFPFVSGIGYLGEGIHVSRIRRKKSLFYARWANMLHRCYDRIENNSSYIECSVCVEWHNFQNFAEWCMCNYYEIGGMKTDLDKDILFKGNKIYSPSTCVFVPHNINAMIVKREVKRGVYPIGVYYDITKNKLVSQYTNQITNKRVRIALFEPHEKERAFTCYKMHKEAHIKEVAEMFKTRIPDILYQALLRYEIAITD